MSRDKKRKKKLVAFLLIVLSCAASASIYHKRRLKKIMYLPFLVMNNILPVPVVMKKTTYLKAVRMKINTTI